MKGKYSTREAAKKLGRTWITLHRHIVAGTIKPPPIQTVYVGASGKGMKIRLWSDRDIEKARKVLAGTKPGRKKKA